MKVVDIYKFEWDLSPQVLSEEVQKCCQRKHKATDYTLYFS